ncbi:MULTISPECIES: TonB-dependent siderophore receptor [unclassified Picosynechococcus]|uniref:TonB-dependent siderophore receptor n=1 Tax=unclassified Picosynechococcus TaxID=3079910 RepID=UPI0007459104|nr:MULTISPECIES: TonB-dependent siderophore receptor [unclassified Picosynechococcus]AMA10798.1 ligand-gated channel [Picosynechococcus sp. PCC 73109]ANV92195.1 ligand-gated channel [Picosynechococcus sp. PCC 8807]
MKELTYSLGVASGMLVVLAPAVVAQTVISNIRINPTSLGVEVFLDSDQAIAPEVNQRLEGDRLILEVENAQLTDGAILPDFAPQAGLETIEITQISENTVEIILVGETAAPFVDVLSQPSGLLVQVTPDDFVDNLELIVTATRTEAEEAAVPRSVTVISQAEIARQADLNRDLSSILAKLVPGLSPSTETTSIFGQSLRGRNISVLVDGIPQSTNRNAQRDLRTIDPGVIERIEIVRGPSAIYGDGATGGIINIITKQGAATGVESRSTIGFEFSTTNPEDSFGYSLQHSVSGTEDKFDYVADFAIFKTGGFFDADGDRIPPDPLGQGGLADLRSINLFGKLGYNIDDNQRLQFSFNYFSDDQDSDFALNPSPSGDKAEARPGLVLPDQPGTENTLVSLAYSNDDLFGSQLNSQLYYRDYSTRFYPFDDDFGTFGGEVLQSEVESEKIGGRLDINTPLAAGDRLSLLWGVDYFYEESAQPADLFDEPTFEASNGLVFEQIGTGFLSPPTEQKNLGLFAQLNWNVTDQLVLNGGIRQEFIDVSVDDFTTLAGNDVTGGELNYDATLFNVGAVYALNDNVNIFGNFAQGFSIADVARSLRTSPGGSVENLRPEAQRVDNYELGIRGNWGNVQASIAGFYSYSDLGTTFDSAFTTIRDPQRIYGVEADLRTQLSEQLALGGTFTYTDGERDANNDGDFESGLPSFQIPPVKLTGFVEYEPVEGWENRLQLLYSAGRDPKGNGFGLGEVESYLTADFISSYDTGAGKIQLGVENLFNAEYFPIIAQVYGGRNQFAGRGRTISLSYSLDW